MLPKQLLLVPCFLLITIISSAQKTIVDTKQTNTSTNINKETIEMLPFSRNINEFMIQQNLGYTRTKYKNSDEHSSDINLNIDYNRFVIDHVGIGVELDLSSFKAEYGNTDSKSSNWIAYANVIYGTKIGNDFNLYGKLSVGVGNVKNVYNSTTTKEGQFGYKLQVGSPVHLFDGGGNYITPFIGYNVLQQKNSGIKFTNSDFELGFRFQNYSPCSGYSCDCHHGRSFSRNAYDRGRSFIGYSSMGDFDFGKSKYEYGNTDFKTDISGGLLNLEYGYYFIPNIAIGAGISWNNGTLKSPGGKSSFSDLMVTPMLTFNLPSDNCWNNTFIQGGYNFGYEKTSSPGSSDQKNKLSGYCVNIGFNDFFGKHIAFTPKIGYEWQTSKNDNTDIKTKWSGLEFSLGGSLHF